jgi:hypothetical protein
LAGLGLRGIAFLAAVIQLSLSPLFTAFSKYDLRETRRGEEGGKREGSEQKEREREKRRERDGRKEVIT